MATGYKDNNGKFHPIKSKKGSRMMRDEPFEIRGVRLPSRADLIGMQRQPKSRRNIGSDHKHKWRYDHLQNKAFCKLCGQGSSQEYWDMRRKNGVLIW